MAPVLSGTPKGGETRPSTPWLAALNAWTPSERESCLASTLPEHPLVDVAGDGGGDFASGRRVRPSKDPGMRHGRGLAREASLPGPGAARGSSDPRGVPESGEPGEGTATGRLSPSCNVPPFQ